MGRGPCNLASLLFVTFLLTSHLFLLFFPALDMACSAVSILFLAAIHLNLQTL